VNQKKLSQKRMRKNLKRQARKQDNQKHHRSPSEMIAKFNQTPDDGVFSALGRILGKQEEK
jgi:hypothetical protein